MHRGCFLFASISVIGIALLTPAFSSAQSLNRYPYNYGFTQGHYPYYYSYLFPPAETSVHYTPQYHTVYYPGLGYSLRYEATGTANLLWNGYQSFSPGAPAAPEPSAGQTVTLDVRVPDPAAEVWIEGQKTAQKGTLRRFVSPSLPLGRRYRYEIRAEWMQGGRKIEQTQSVTIEPGHRVAIDFLPTTASR